MFGGPKPLASLSSGLLARKGQARPAMRPQGGSFAATADDLGWNDMGAPVPIPPVPIPPVLVAREALQEEFAEPAPAPAAAPQAPPTIASDAPVAVKPVSLATAARIGREAAAKTAKGSKAAFTLRLDADRHLRLRLASAVANQSSQALVAQALDAFLKTLPEVEALVAQLPKPKTR
ncbi:hypothetical protein [Sphingomonas sp. CROZ-RG-20F-R02-07]|uniref:hypothetical protein n=1 Tax=Sphingomonas sp. CROZ-RG-20F-R02-07 TaxID=2914832 RepID=UPI001F573FFB|nr:hypothetical protein [Sphingomonas sp. CROZ-RG-20F-R02-07]